MSTGTDSVDRLGVVASTACAIHCPSVAVLPTALSAAGLSALLGHEAEWGFTIVAACLAASAMVVGWRRHAARASGKGRSTCLAPE